ncbi:Cell division protein [Daphnia sinensis]|uniref:Cell division protein n=1 Tax=Daphnia sinensis TaxID=1820382 RepID=A0AAD5KT73_9CRUS|nr:Cell division protein [Daphnia sinensis]
MLFITAGMGGGTGTGASPIIAKAAKANGVSAERLKLRRDSKSLNKHVDSYLVISNDRLREIFGNLTLGSAFAQADNILTTAAKGYINVDFKDVRTVMQESGVAIMGSFAAEGENRALRAVEGALASPLLKDNEIEGARYILLNISSGDKEVTMDEVSIITDFIQQEAGLAADLIWGNCSDPGLGEKISVTIIATGFQTMEEREVEKSQIRKVSLLTPEQAPLVKPVQSNNFIQEKKEELTPEINEPVLKSTQDSQVDLFAGYFHSAPKVEELKVEDPNTIRHALEEEITMEVSPVETSFEFEIKTQDFTPQEQEPEVMEIQMLEEEVTLDIQPAVEEVSVTFENPDENKTDDSIEEQLRKSKERILRLKDLSMKLRTSNGLQELENEPATNASRCPYTTYHILPNLRFLVSP